MRFITIFLVVLVISSTSSAERLAMSRARTMSEVDRSKFYAYKERLKEKRSRALDLRGVYNSGKVHTYWTAMVYPRYYPRYYPYNYERLPVRRVERSEYRYDYDYKYERGY